MSDSESEDVVFAAGYEYSIDLESLRQGAEARLIECVYLGKKAIIKERFHKTYRHPILDGRLNKSRTKNELRGIVKARELGVVTPSIYFVDAVKHIIIMERIEGPTAKNWIEERRKTNLAEFENEMLSFGKILGRSIGKIHNGGMIHGDLTTSNVILRNSKSENLVFIDFGLSSQAKVTPEEKGVDLYVLERAITSTHINSDSIFEGVLKGYSEVSEKQAKAVEKKFNEIRLRGRKRDMTG